MYPKGLKEGPWAPITSINIRYIDKSRNPPMGILIPNFSWRRLVIIHRKWTRHIVVCNNCDNTTIIESHVRFSPEKRYNRYDSHQYSYIFECITSVDWIFLQSSLPSSYFFIRNNICSIFHATNLLEFICVPMQHGRSLFKTVDFVSHLQLFL